MYPVLFPWTDMYPEVAVTMTLHGQDEITQDVIATFPLEVFELDITDHGGEIVHVW
jgi:hypothetical protein